MSTISISEIVDIIRSLFPRGRLYDWYVTTSNVYKLLAATADTLQLYCYDLIDTMRREFNPATATVAQKIPDFERSLGLSGTLVARNGTQAQRRTAVVSKLREFGGFTPANVRAIIGPLLGYADPADLEVMEVSRTALRDAHSYHIAATTALPNNTTVRLPIFVRDQGVVSSAGVFVRLDFDVNVHPDYVVRLTAPNEQFKVWTGFGIGNTIEVGTRELAGIPIQGTWTLSVTNGPADDPGAQTIFDGSHIFVEGIAPGQATGGAIFEWGVYADPALVSNPDYPSVLESIERIRHGHTTGSPINSKTPRPDTDSGEHAAIPDKCIPT